MRTDELDYNLPQRLIAARPVEPRDAARLLIYRRSTGELTHGHIADLSELLNRDVLVVNDTAVIPARFESTRTDSGGAAEGLFLTERGTGRWEVMLRSNGRLRPGLRLALNDARTGEATPHELTLLEREGAGWIVAPNSALPAETILDAVGRTPLPPYIRRARGEQAVDDASDRAWYQTVYAEWSKRLSVAAPTAGLHFTPRLLDLLTKRSQVRVLPITLHVGAGTFQPIAAERVENHAMHEERFSVPRATLREIHALRPRGCRVIAVGTTTVRALESIDPSGSPEAGDGDIVGATRLLIQPPFEFRWVDGMMTNFHLPRSTLLALVAAMVGLDRLKELYRIAVDREYRFYSYGDAMLILP